MRAVSVTLVLMCCGHSSQGRAVRGAMCSVLFIIFERGRRARGQSDLLLDRECPPRRAAGSCNRPSSELRQSNTCGCKRVQDAGPHRGSPQIKSSVNDINVAARARENVRDVYDLSKGMKTGGSHGHANDRSPYEIQYDLYRVYRDGSSIHTVLV